VNDPQPTAITLPFRAFLAAANIPERKARELVAKKEIDSVRIGKARYVVMSSYHAYLARLLAADTPKRGGDFGRKPRGEGETANP
jgi:hypothetical protein